MSTTTNYKDEVCSIYHDSKQPRLPVTPQLVYQAANTVEHLFPPHSTDDAFKILAALNLLNAAVKMPWGAQMVTYAYIKGYAACMFTVQAYRQLPDLFIYWDKDDDVAYFRVYGIQISFHHVTRFAHFAEVLPIVNHMEQKWDGLRLQLIATELFLMANPTTCPCCTAEEEDLSHIMLNFKQPDLTPIIEKYHKSYADGYATLRLVLNFNIWHSDLFVLYRRKDNHDFPVMRFTGQNYKELMTFLTEENPKVPLRNKKHLHPGCLYYVSPQMRICCLPVSRYILCLTQNSYLRVGHSIYNLCLSYSMARYLAMLFPTLLFVNTLEYNRIKTEQKYYALKDIATEPLDSEARRLKVWIAIDIRGQLQHFDPSTLPGWLINDYVNTPPYYQEFEKTIQAGRYGILAYRKHHLLPPVYKNIYITNYHARVTRDDDKMAIYSLHAEQFISPFVYDRIWYDSDHCVILGLVDGEITVVYQFLPEIYRHIVRKRLEYQRSALYEYYEWLEREESNPYVK
ncbi:MAG: hypothetical protein IJ533_10225 [Prevotella sp.]|nr:hypothetical protein [Prevotella sp.]MBQ8488007.1 hypothetical protein [Prevotella sp.]